MQNASLTITNPLVLYRALVSTHKIRPDPAQLRLALHLQKLYERLKDYEPTVEYSQRLQRLGRAIGDPSSNASAGAAGNRTSRAGLWQSLMQEKERRDSLALTRVLSDHEEALKLESPRGLMVHGEVGTGKSMLIDLFADCLPNRKKRRWHFNTFMLEAFSRLEQLRVARLARTQGGGVVQDDHSLLWLARDLIEKSPILFLDEFQRRSTGPPSMDCILGVVVLVLGETDGSKTGYFFLTQIFVDFDCSNVSHHELTISLSPRNVIVRVHRDVLDLQGESSAKFVKWIN